MTVNWGIGVNGNTGFQNALAQGYQMGSAIRQREDEKQYKNALATVFQGGGMPQGGAQQIPGGGGLVATPEQQAESDRLTRKFGVEGVTVDDRTGTVYGPDGQKYNQALSVIAQQNPQLYMQLQQREEARRAQEAAQRQEQMGTIRQLLVKAGESPEGWAQAMSAAQSLQIDTSTLPQQYDPEWVKKQLFIHDALSDPKTMAGIGAELELAGYQPGTPEFQQAVREVMNNKYAAEYTAADGTTRRRTILNLQGPQPGAIEDGYRFRGGDPSDPSSWEPVEPTIQNTPAPQVGANGMPAMLSRQQYQATVASMGKAATDAWMQRNNIRIGN